MSLADLTRRLAAVERPTGRRTAVQHSEAHQRRVAAARFEADRRRALSGDITPLKRARLTADGGRGMTVAALSILADVSEFTIAAGERGRPLSPRIRRKLARALDCPPEDIA
jgi:hypothetical protein